MDSVKVQNSSSSATPAERRNILLQLPDDASQLKRAGLLSQRDSANLFGGIGKNTHSSAIHSHKVAKSK